MKKIFTLLFSIGSLTSVLAQQGQRDPHNQSGKYEQPAYPSHDNKPVVSDKTKDYNDYDNRSENSYSFTGRERDFQIQKINREFDSRINAERNKRYLRPQEKRRQVEMLERERYQEIRNINDRFSNRKNGRYDDHNSKGDSRKW